jgi:hypothetical protein
MTMSSHLILIYVLAVALADDGPVISPPPWSCYFGGRQATLHYRITAPTAYRGQASWSFSIADRVLARRETPVDVQAGQPGDLVLRLDLPPTRPGVIIPGNVSIRLAPGPEVAHPLWIFPEDPFIERRAALEAMNIILFDPEKNTAAVFERSQIPFRAVRDVASLAAAGNGLIVVGEGVSFRTWRGLAPAMIDAASRARPVLCLAPAPGEIPLPGLGHSDLPSPCAVSLRQADVIGAFDKRLDAVWPPDGKTAAARIELASGRAGIFGEISAADHGWPWIEFTFPAPRGRLALCGFAVIAKWPCGPTPRYLLAHLLARLSGQPVLPPPRLSEPPKEP